MKLYGAAPSPYVRKVRSVLALKGIDYDLELVIPYATPEGFEKISPLKKVPALEDGDTCLADSTVICHYLEHRYPENPVMPTEPGARANTHWLEEYADTKLAESAAGIFFERLLKPAMRQQPADEEKVSDYIERKLPVIQDYLEAQLPEQGFINGELGLADISIATMFINAGYGGYEIDTEGWPKLAALVQAYRQHPSIAPILEDEKALLEQLLPKS